MLAGGRSTRLGGGDKALRLLAGRPLLGHAIDRLRPQLGTLILSANGDLSRFAQFGLPTVADRISSFQGPLAGIDAGMMWISRHRPDAKWLLSAAADAPFLPGDLAGRLYSAVRNSAATVAVARSRGRLHPVFALWSVHLAADLARWLDRPVDRRSDRRVDSFVFAQGTEGSGWIAVDWSVGAADGRDPASDPFFNVNTQEAFDLAAAALGEDGAGRSGPA